MKRGRKGLALEKIEAIREAYRQPGATIHAIAKQLDICAYTIAKYTADMELPGKMACPECGLLIRSKNKLHTQSTYHRQAKRIKALLAQECMTLEEIGKRIGVTRERVRQIAQLIGVDTSPASRTTVCTL